MQVVSSNRCSLWQIFTNFNTCQAKLRWYSFDRRPNWQKAVQHQNCRMWMTHSTCRLHTHWTTEWPHWKYEEYWLVSEYPCLLYAYCNDQWLIHFRCILYHKCTTSLSMPTNILDYLPKAVTWTFHLYFRKQPRSLPKHHCGWTLGWHQQF